jgi:hypothetical protein
MSQAGFTPLIPYHSTTAGNVPLAANMAIGEIALNASDRIIYTKNGTGLVVAIGSAGGSLSFLTVTGTNTLLGTLAFPITSYVTGAMYSFIVQNTNTGAVTLNIDGLGAKAVLRNATDPIQAGDLVAGNIVVVLYDGTAFQLISVGFGGGATGAGGDKIFVENGQTVTTSYTIPLLTNAMSTGPIAIDSGATVTVQSGSVWIVL